jgi:AcrR family transcriptional regulator
VTEPERPLRADARRNRLRVLDAAERAFAEQGEAVPMEEIARQAGVGVGTIYRHFPTKEALMEAMLVRRYERLADEAGALAAGPDPGGAFFELFSRIVAEAGANKTFSHLLVRAGVDIKTATSAVGQRLVEIFGTLLERAQQAGAVRADLRQPEVVAVLSGLSLATERAGWDDQTRDRALSIVFAGLRAEPDTT